jgi:hypothetical protein
MALQAIIFLSLGALVLILVVINAFLIRYFYKTNKKIDTLLEGGKIKSFKDIFMSQKGKNEDLEDKIKDAFLKIKNLESVCERTIQKTGIVRFNPFKEIGGNQSFVIALLDDKNNGFVISSLFVKEGNRVYAKAVNNGKSDHSLSEEEVEAINKAVNSK